jgi:hypothetical protein
MDSARPYGVAFRNRDVCTGSHRNGALNMAGIDSNIREALDGRPMSYDVTEESIPRVLSDIARLDRIGNGLTMELRLPSFTPRLRLEIPLLYKATRLPSVRAMDITFLNGATFELGEAVAPVIFTALADLEEFAPHLQKLKLDFSDLQFSRSQYKVRLEGVKIIQQISESKAFITNLHTLWIDLCGNEIGDDGAAQLGNLRYCRALRTLRLVLRDNKIGDVGALGLAELSHTPNLHELHLGLGANRIDDDGAVALSRLKQSPNLQVLYLDLEANRIGDWGAFALSRFGNRQFRSDWKHIHTLHLGLKNNRIRVHGAVSLSSLASTGVFHHLRLDLDNNPIGDDGVRHVMAMVGGRYALANGHTVDVSVENNNWYDWLRSAARSLGAL